MILTAHIQTPISEEDVYKRLKSASGFLGPYINLYRSRNVLTFNRNGRANVFGTFKLGVNKHQEESLDLTLEVEIPKGRIHLIAGLILFLIIPLVASLITGDSFLMYAYIFPVPILVGILLYQLLRADKIIEAESKKELSYLTALLNGSLKSSKIINYTTHNTRIKQAPSRHSAIENAGS